MYETRGLRLVSMEFSLELRSVIVNYHYVEDPRKEFSGIFPCPVAEFERQVLFLSKNFKIGSVEDVFRNAHSGEREKICAITFDDGLRGQYEFAAPILETYKVSAIFFPITSAFDFLLPPAHALHVLLSVMSPKQLIETENEFFKTDFPSLYPVPLDRRIREGKRMHEDSASANAKEAVAMLSPEKQKEFFDFSFRKNSIDPAEWSKELFMTKEEVLDLKSRGFSIGSHFHSHVSLENADRATAEREVKRSAEILKEITGENPGVFSYPHGRYNDHVLGVLEEAGAGFGVTIERREVKIGDSPYGLPRFDTNDIRDYLKMRK